MLQTELSVVAALMPPDGFDVALMRVWLGLKRSLTDCSWPVVPRPESSWPAALVAQPVLGPMLLQVCASRYLLTCSDSDGQDLCPQSVAVFECPMI